MGKVNQSEKSLRKYFKKKMVVDINELFHFLETTSRMTAFRHLRKIGYLSSYSHAGRYYTLVEIPIFDEHGLWYFNEISFSKAGTLKATITVLLDKAEAGYTHRDLRQLLRVRVQNTLNDLVSAGLIERQAMEGVFVYFSGNTQRIASQLNRRHRLIQSEHQGTSPAPMEIIEVLLELLQTEVNWEPKAISKSLKARGVLISMDKAGRVLERYHLKKNP